MCTATAVASRPGNIEDAHGCGPRVPAVSECARTIAGDLRFTQSESPAHTATSASRHYSSYPSAMSQLWIDRGSQEAGSESASPSPSLVGLRTRRSGARTAAVCSPHEARTKDGQTLGDPTIETGAIAVWPNGAVRPARLPDPELGTIHCRGGAVGSRWRQASPPDLDRFRISRAGGPRVRVHSHSTVMRVLRRIRGLWTLAERVDWVPWRTSSSFGW